MAVEIKYWEKDAWAGYVKNDVLPVYEYSLAIFNAWKLLKEMADGKLLSDIIRGRTALEYVFVGGTAPPDKYEEGGLAQIYKALLGTSVNLREYYFLKAHGKEPETVCTISETLLVTYVDHISVLLKRVVERAYEFGLISQAEIQNAEESSKRIAEAVVAKPESLPERLCDFLNKALRLVLPYNEYTRFIWHLRKIPKKYIEEFYPELLKPEVRDFIQKLLGLRKYIEPQVEDPEIRDLYTIFSFDHAVSYHFTSTPNLYIDEGRCYSYEYLSGELEGCSSDILPYNTIGGCLCRVNELIWGLFKQRKLLELVVKGDVPNPLHDWMVMAEKWLSELKATKGYRYFERLPPPNSYEALSILDEYLPGIFVGKFELVADPKGKELVVAGRRGWF